ncbi:MAG TPA: oligoendopeptidase F, partial [Agrobacterium sp.]|nr:oligoendopeptidase F [Agrobacterium sp.]
MTLNRSIPQPVFSLAETSGPVLGDLPDWKLSDLYPSGDSPEYKGDLEKAAAMATAFEGKWKGKLETAARATGVNGIGAALKEYEALDDLIGRIGSFAGLTYFSDTSNPANGKLYGDAQAKLTDISA